MSDGASSYKPTLATPFEMCLELQGFGSGVALGSHCSSMLLLVSCHESRICVHLHGIAEHITRYKLGIIFPLKLDGKRDCACIGKIVLLVDIVVLELC